MTTESTPAASFIDCVKVLRPERRQLLLGLPHFITYLIAGVDGEIDHWELILVLEAIDETEGISPDFGACRESYQAEISPYLDRIRKATKEKGASLMYNLKWMLTDLEKYQELMPLLPIDLQENIRRYVYRTGMAIAQASDDGEAEMAKPERGIGAAEYTYLALVWDAFEITGDPDLPEVSPQGNQIRSVYSPNQKNTQLLGSLA
jgi:hypothetical protein